MKRNGLLVGYNTDCSAAVNAIEAGLGATVSGLTVVVIGAGGAGRAIAFGTTSRGARTIVVNRSPERAVSLAADVNCEFASWDAVQRGELRGDVLVNTTSIGMHPDTEVSPVPASTLKNFGLVFDAVYAPLNTLLLRDARSAGVKTVDGLEMFIGQAAEQFKLFTGVGDDVAPLMRSALLRALLPERQ